MIRIAITSDSRGEGKTSTAVKLLQEHPDWWMVVKSPRLVRYVRHTFALPPSIAMRVFSGDTDFRGLKFPPVMIEDLD